MLCLLSDASLSISPDLKISLLCQVAEESKKMRSKHVKHRDSHHSGDKITASQLRWGAGHLIQ
jgi:hypothetical protein